MSNTVQDGKVVIIHYTLTSSDGRVLDSSREGSPLPYLAGAGNIVPGLEHGLSSAAVGERRTVEVPPAEAYGELLGAPPQRVPRTAFPENAEFEVGMQFLGQTEDGQQIAVWVAGVETDTVLLSQEHPLAGETLHFDVEIVQIRDATDDEKAHGHPHGITGTEGHHH